MEGSSATWVIQESVFPYAGDSSLDWAETPAVPKNKAELNSTGRALKNKLLLELQPNKVGQNQVAESKQGNFLLI